MAFSLPFGSRGGTIDRRMEVKFPIEEKPQCIPALKVELQSSTSIINIITL